MNKRVRGLVLWGGRGAVQATQGVPRKVNRLAHYALTSAALTQARTVSAEHVQSAREEVAP